MKVIFSFFFILLFFVTVASEDEARLASFKQETDKAMSLLNSYKFDEFQKQVLFIEKEFAEYNNDLSFLMQRGTFAQLIEPKAPAVADKIFLDIITKDPFSIKVSDGQLFSSANPEKFEKAVNFLKCGTIFGMLNNKTSKYIGSHLDRETKNRLVKIEVEKLITELKKTPEGTRCITFARHWEIMTTKKNPQKDDFKPVKSFLKKNQDTTNTKNVSSQTPFETQKIAIVSQPPQKKKTIPSCILSAQERIQNVSHVENVKENNHFVNNLFLYIALTFIGLSVIFCVFGILKTNRFVKK